MEINELFDVRGKVAVVTGGSRGIGYMIAEGLVRNGVRVYITARKAAACDEAAARLAEFGECVSFPADLSGDEGIASFVERFAEREGRLDILVNNAGAAWGAPIGDFPDAGFQKVLDVNVKAPFMLTQALMAQLKAGATADDPARVIMIGSVDGIKVPFGDNYSYSASKAGIHMLARHMAHHRQQHRPRALRVEDDVVHARRPRSASHRREVDATRSDRKSRGRCRSNHLPVEPGRGVAHRHRAPRRRRNQHPWLSSASTHRLMCRAGG